MDHSMSGRGIIWGTIFSIPFWFIVILLIKAGIIGVKTLILMGLTLSAPALFLILTSSIRNKQDKQDWDIFIKNIPTPNIQSKIRPQDSSEIGTPGPQL